MDSDTFPYSKQVKDFGHPCNFESPKETLPVGWLPNPKKDKARNFSSSEVHVARNPNFRTFSNIPQMSENTVNTERVSTVDKKMYHYEGGWPGEVEDIGDANKRAKYIRKHLERNPDNSTDKFMPKLQVMVNDIKEVMRENNQIDMYEEYFEGEEVEHNIEKLSLKTLMLFKDPTKKSKRSISKIAWHPDGPREIAAAYSIMRFQKQPADMDYDSYIWDIKNPNTPKNKISPESPIVTLAYNHREPDTIGVGCYNGTVGIWDVRTKGNKLVKTSQIEHSHHEPVTDLIWMSSKGGKEFVTCSTDGNVFWWDSSSLKEPTYSLQIRETDAEDAKVVGCTSLEYVSEIGPKYWVGTETGSVVTVTKKPKNEPIINYKSAFGLGMGRHLGPVYSVKRNLFNYKFSMSVGDWSVGIWEDDTRVPIMRTRFHPSYLTDGCWAPNRMGLFFVTRRDGWLDIWDYYYRQNEVALSHKVSDSALTTIKLNTIAGNALISNPELIKTQGRYAAIGDMAGTITLLELCPSLYKREATNNSNEKNVVEDIFKREALKEKNLKVASIKRKNKRARAQKQAPKESHSEQNTFKMEELDAEFNKVVVEAEKELIELYESDDEMKKELEERISSRKNAAPAEAKEPSQKEEKAPEAEEEEKKPEEEPKEEEKKPEEEEQPKEEEKKPEEEQPKEEAKEEEKKPEEEQPKEEAKEEDNGELKLDDKPAGDEKKEEGQENEGELKLDDKPPAEEEPKPEPEAKEEEKKPEEEPKKAEGEEKKKPAMDDDSDGF